MAGIKTVFSDRIAIGVIRLCVCVMVASVAAIVWWQAGDPYQVMQLRILKISEYFSDYLEKGVPVYFGNRESPLRLQIEVTGPFVGNVIEPNLIDDAVQCIKTGKSSIVQVTQRSRTLSSPGDAFPFQLPETIVLFANENDAKGVFEFYAPSMVTPDFRAADSSGHLQSCINGAYSKYRDERAVNIADAKREFYVNGSLLVGKVLFLELMVGAALFWVLKGFIRSVRPPTTD